MGLGNGGERGGVQEIPGWTGGIGKGTLGVDYRNWKI